jgi:hypothetical protein
VACVCWGGDDVDSSSHVGGWCCACVSRMAKDCCCTYASRRLKTVLIHLLLVSLHKYSRAQCINGEKRCEAIYTIGQNEAWFQNGSTDITTTLFTPKLTYKKQKGKQKDPLSKLKTCLVSIN